MKQQLQKCLYGKSRNFYLFNNTYYNHKYLFHSSPHLLRKRGHGGTQNIVIDAAKEEIFPTRRGHVMYEEELALSDKIRSVRIAKRKKMHQIETSKHANLIFEILHEALHNGRLKKADVTWNYLEFAPKFIDDSNNDNNDNNKISKKVENEMDHYVQIDLVDVGFEIVGVTMPNHRQYCIIWWKFNNLCKLNGGIKLIDKVLELYKRTLRAIIARKMVLKITPRLIFRMINDENNENIVYHKEKMDYLIENTLIEQYQKYLGIEFKDDDNEQDQKYKNETFHDILMNKIYGDWRSYDQNGKMLKGYNMKNQRKELNDKWINTFLNKVNRNKPTQIEKDMIKNKRKRKHALKNKEKAKVINRILSTDPQFIAHNNHQQMTKHNNNDILISTKRQQIDIIPSKTSRFVNNNDISNKMVYDTQDLDLIGFVE